MILIIVFGFTAAAASAMLKQPKVSLFTQEKILQQNLKMDLNKSQVWIQTMTFIK